MRKLLSWFLGLFRKKAVDDIVIVDNYPEGDEVDTIMLGRGEGPMRDYPCGHKGYSRLTVFLFGWEERVRTEKMALCHECTIAFLQQHTIRCAACGVGIGPGSAVALHPDSSEELARRDVGTRVDGSWIGCMLLSCCEGIEAYSGHWTEQGFRPAFSSVVGEIEPLKEGS